MIDKKNILNCYLEEFNDLYFRNIDKMKIKNVLLNHMIIIQEYLIFYYQYTLLLFYYKNKDKFN